jgi:hypothetical protein
LKRVETVGTPCHIEPDLFAPPRFCGCDVVPTATSVQKETTLRTVRKERVTDESACAFDQRWCGQKYKVKRHEVRGKSMVHVDEVRGWIDRTVLDPSGHKVGTVSQVFVDDATDSPEWATVNTGLFGRRASFVPIEGLRQEGDDLLIPWDRAQVKGAPQVDDDGDGHLTAVEEVQLYRYYAKEQRSAADAGEGSPGEATDAGATGRETDRHEADAQPPGNGQARLRKYVVTEEVHPVSRVLFDDSPADEAQESSHRQ